MTQSEASDACNRMAEAHAAIEADQETATRTHQRVHKAVFDQAFEFIPKETAWTVIRSDGHSPPRLVALDGLRLYTLTVGDLDGDLTPSTSCRAVTLDPATAVVDCETKFTGIRQNASPVSRLTTWTFDFGGDPLVLRTDVNVDAGRLPQDDWFAQSLAGALGWKRLPSTPEDDAT